LSEASLNELPGGRVKNRPEIGQASFFVTFFCWSKKVKKCFLKIFILLFAPKERIKRKQRI